MENQELNKMKKILLILLVSVVQGCAAKPAMYEWGRYEELIYKGYAAPDKASPEEHIRILEADYQVARSKNRALPPGYHAQLGVLYFQVGNLEQAEKSFATEKELFPESRQFMERLIDKIKKRGAS